MARSTVRFIITLTKSSLPPAHPALHPQHQLCSAKIYMRIDKEMVSNATEQRASPRVKASPSPRRRPHRSQLIAPGIACYVCAPLSPLKYVKFHATPGEEEFRCHLDAGAEPKKEPLKPYRSLPFSATALPAALLLRRCHVSEHHGAR